MISTIINKKDLYHFLYYLFKLIYTISLWFTNKLQHAVLDLLVNHALWFISKLLILISDKNP